jgi:uncharacterized SAM-binding protein YcdF (DUF218 family)
MADRKRRGARRRVARWAVAAVALAALVLVGARERWLPTLGAFLVVADPLEAADAVAVLGGKGSARVSDAARLVSAGYGGWLVLTEVALPGLWTRYSDVARVEAGRAGLPPERILVASGLVFSTYDEALALREVAAARGWGSLIVVTAPYHTRRTRLTFEEVFAGTGVRLAIRPAPGDSYHVQSWWEEPTGRHATCGEYLKLVLHAAGARPDTRAGPPVGVTPTPAPLGTPTPSAAAAPPVIAMPWPTIHLCY